MPMFPLGSALLPGGVLPLVVFEPRYRQMVQDLLRDDVDPPEFGVVLIERGHEVGGGDARTTVGTVARIVDISALPDGRYALVSVGTERLRVNAWLPDDPYPLADVDVWPDDDRGVLDLDAAGARVADLHDRVRLLNAEVAALGPDLAGAEGDLTPPPDTEISDDPHLGLYHLASLSPIGPADRQRMLETPTLIARMDVFAEALDDAAAVFRFRSS
jgi:Lon protease-like protein